MGSERQSTLRVISVVGTRPNFVKLAAVHRAMAEKSRGVRHDILHTGQHYDASLSDAFFRDLDIPAANINLNIGSGSHAEQTGKILIAIEAHLSKPPRPDWVLVYGDVNSTAAAALCAAKMGIRVGHVEAGLRSRDRTMPEELNRIIADHLSDLLFATTPGAAKNLWNEGIPRAKVCVVGNTVIDTLIWARNRAGRISTGVSDPFSLVTLHRPSNVDDPRTLKGIWKVLSEIARDSLVVFPVHPRTRRAIESAGLRPPVNGNLRIIDPVGYIDFLSLLSHAQLVLTDSGGIQDETSFLGVPCLTLRPNTERPETIEKGTNRLIGNDPSRILRAWREASRRRRRTPNRPRIGKWDDGRAAHRIVEALIRHRG